MKMITYEEMREELERLYGKEVSQRFDRAYAENHFQETWHLRTYNDWVQSFAWRTSEEKGGFWVNILRRNDIEILSTKPFTYVAKYSSVNQTANP